MPRTSLLADPSAGYTIGATAPPLPDPMTPFASHFALKDADRTDFRLNPQRDADAYVEGEGQERTKLLRVLEERHAVQVVDGDFGSGKTHLLHSIVQRAKETRAVVFVTLGGLQRRSDFYAVHPLLLSELFAQLLPGVRSIGSAEIDAALAKRRLTHPDLSSALKRLLVPTMGAESESAMQARSWLLGSRALSAAKLLPAGFGSLMREALSPDGLVRLYEVLADLYATANKRGVLLILDEGESFTNVVDPDAQESIGAALRRLVDPENDVLDFFWGLNLPKAMRATHPMLRSDVHSRIGTRHTSLGPLGSLEQTRHFVDRLWPHLTTRNSLRPFLLDSDALTFLHAQLDNLRRAFPGPGDPPLAASPSRRDLLHILTMIGQTAVNKGMKPETLITPAHIRAWFDLEGGQ